MASLPRRAKPGNEWTTNDLEAYNITIISQDTLTFFGIDPLPVPDQHRDLLTHATADEMERDDNYQIIRYMDLAMNPVADEESAVVDFTMQLLRTLSYVGRAIGRDLRSRKDIPFIICGENKYARTDVCMIDKDEILLPVQEDKRYAELNSDPVPQLIAQAIAAVQYDNRVRDFVGLPPLDFKLMAGITMNGTSPTFFKIPVTSQLMDAVMKGQYPSTSTIVAFHQPDIPRPARRLTEGMRPLDNRRVVIACFEAFKQFVN